jgi:cobalt-zinc-cadmium efflux system outer membrane protein
MRRFGGAFLVLSCAALCVGAPCRARAQSATIDTSPPGVPGSPVSSLPSPGAANGTLVTPGAGAQATLATPGQGPISGRVGVSGPRVSQEVTMPGGGEAGGREAAIARIPVLPNAELPNYGLLSLPTGPEDEGPASGLTLDMAIERMMRENLDLLAKTYEIPQAEADVLTASLRANPVFYADTQLEPYGQFSRVRPGGPGQYDVNVSHPIDASRKRQARMNSAGRALQVLQESLKDAARTQVDNLYTAYVDVLAARRQITYARAALEGLKRLQETTARRVQELLDRPAALDQVNILLYNSELSLVDAEQVLLKNKFTLGNLMNMLPSQAEGLQLRGSLFDRQPPAPTGDALVEIALMNRPDLAAWRAGILRAEADVRLAVANRWQDLYLLVQPYTFQNLQPYGVKSATSWSVGITVPMPIYNRNQGAIRRAELNVRQTQIELAALERQVIQEVRKADVEYRTTRDFVERSRKEQLPAAQRVLAAAERSYRAGATDVIALLSSLREFNDFLKSYIDLAVRHRRSMLDLNTAVGRRILP